MTDENYELEPESMLWIPKVSRRRFFFLGALASTAAALGLSSAQEVPRAVVPGNLVPTPLYESDSGLWTVKLDGPAHGFWFVDAGMKYEQRGEGHLEWWRRTRAEIMERWPSVRAHTALPPPTHDRDGNPIRW